MFGNVFGGLADLPALNFRTSFGFNVHAGRVHGLQPDHARELGAQLHQQHQRNSQRVHELDVEQHAPVRQAARSHSFNLLAGQEANRNNNRDINAGIAGLLSTNVDPRYIQDALGDAATKT